MNDSPPRMMVIALVQWSQLVLVLNEWDEFELPSTFIEGDEAFDLPLMQEVKRLFGFRAEPGGLLGRDHLTGGVERIVVSAFFDGDRRRGGLVPDAAIRRIPRSDIATSIREPALARFAELACS
jgi:hypothetical protein